MSATVTALVLHGLYDPEGVEALEAFAAGVEDTTPTPVPTRGSRTRAMAADEPTMRPRA